MLHQACDPVRIGKPLIKKWRQLRPTWSLYYNNIYYMGIHHDMCIESI